MDFASSARAAKYRTRWIAIVANFLWCPDNPPRLWDRNIIGLRKKSVFFTGACKYLQELFRRVG